MFFLRFSMASDLLSSRQPTTVNGPSWPHLSELFSSVLRT